MLKILTEPFTHVGLMIRLKRKSQVADMVNIHIYRYNIIIYIQYIMYVSNIKKKHKHSRPLTIQIGVEGVVYISQAVNGNF